MSTNVTKSSPAKSQLRCRARGEFAEWLAESHGSLAITTYTSGKLVLVSSFDGRLQYRSQRFVRPMGIALAGDKLALAVRKQVLLFERNPTDRNAFTLRRMFNTGKVDAHDVALGNRDIFFANTRYNAITRVSDKKNWAPCWQPPFLEGLVHGDRCHLNGLGMKDGKPAMSTAFCVTGHKGGWREQDRFTGGVAMDIQQNEIVATGLCMPHSPRWHHGQWWLCNSGHGLLSTLDPVRGVCAEVCALRGFTRGLCLVGNHALVGLSKIRHEHILDTPLVRDRYKKITAGVALVDLTSGQQTGSLEFTGGGSEVFEVLFLPATLKPIVRTKKQDAVGSTGVTVPL